MSLHKKVDVIKIKQKLFIVNNERTHVHSVEAKSACLVLKLNISCVVCMWTGFIGFTILWNQRAHGYFLKSNPKTFKNRKRSSHTAKPLTLNR